METQKIVNLLNSSENEYSKFATKKWYIIDSELNGNYSHQNPIKFITKAIESSLCDYSDAYILVTGNIAVTKTIATAAGGNRQRKQPLDAATEVVFKNFAPFENCRMEINDTYVYEAKHINTAMPMYNLIEYSDKYSDSSGSLWSFKRDKITDNIDVTNDNNTALFKYKSNIIGNTENDGIKNGVKIVVPLKYSNNFWRSLEMPLINCKVELPLKWMENCVLTTAPINANANLSGADSATLKITDAKLYVPVVSLSTENNAKLTKQLSGGFKRYV